MLALLNPKKELLKFYVIALEMIDLICWTISVMCYDPCLFVCCFWKPQHWNSDNISIQLRSFLDKLLLLEYFSLSLL